MSPNDRLRVSADVGVEPKGKPSAERAQQDAPGAIEAKPSDSHHPPVDSFAVDANELVRRMQAGEGGDLNGLIERSLADRSAASSAERRAA
ncbi:MAG: hypothetical protein AAF995_05135 [Planctomycetota bacterium]